MKANITNLRETPRDMYRKDELTRQISAIDPATGREIVCARIYYPGSVAYACLWIHGPKYGRGTGKAGGYGYHKASAALDEAIKDAGIVLTGDVYGRDKRNNRPASIGGVGNDAMREAVEAIARAVTGKRRLIIHEAYA